MANNPSPVISLKKTISIIIPTYNGAHKLPALINSLTAQTILPDEIIVVVDGSTDNTLEVLSAFQHISPNLRIIVQGNAGRSAVRNRGASEAKGDLLVFLDDDMLPQPECLATHVTHHQAIQSSILTGSQIDSHNDTDFQRFKVILSQRWSSQLNKIKGRPLQNKSIFLSAANFSIPSSLFRELGGFDPRLTDAEDFDLAVRASEAGVPLYYNHDALAYHEDKITGTSYIKRLRQYRKAHELLRKIEADRYASISLHRPVEPSGMKALFFRFFAQRFWVKWLDQEGLKVIIPKLIRYKLYDYIITANGVFYPRDVPL